MPLAPRNRSSLTAWLALLVTLGWASRRPWLPDWCLLYAGDVLWGALFFTLSAYARPAASSFSAWLVGTLVTVGIELSQLYQAPWAQALRATRLGGLLLGHFFSWSDTVCVAVGATLAALLDGWRRRSRTPAN